MGADKIESIRKVQQIHSLPIYSKISKGQSEAINVVPRPTIVQRRIHSMLTYLPLPSVEEVEKVVD